MLLPIFFGFITFFYLCLIIAFIIGWEKVKSFNLKGISAESSFSMIIPFRNETENLSSLFQSLLELNYPKSKFEILLVNDSSEDNSEELVKAFIVDNPQLNIQLLQNLRTSNSPKKDAIKTGIKFAKFDHIITTDADCRVPVNWLKYFDEVVQTSNPDLIAGPVGFSRLQRIKTPYFQQFEEMDFMSLQASTVGSFGINKAFMANAANLCYKKKVFTQASGFAENQEIASGDDVFLLQNLRKAGREVFFIKNKEASVYTGYQKSIPALINQRNRWAAKTSAYPSLFAKLTGIVVFLMNFSLIVFTGMALFKLFPYKILMFAFLMKFNVDFILIYKSVKFMKRESLMRQYLWSSLIYPFFTSYIALTALYQGYEWKGRKFKK
jgi:poly-beta-1,6-N-acetyl-D-glucosamine synthase